MWMDHQQSHNNQESLSLLFDCHDTLAWYESEFIFIHTQTTTTNHSKIKQMTLNASQTWQQSQQYFKEGWKDPTPILSKWIHFISVASNVTNKLANIVCLGICNLFHCLCCVLHYWKQMSNLFLFLRILWKFTNCSHSLYDNGNLFQSYKQNSINSTGHIWTSSSNRRKFSFSFCSWTSLYQIQA